MDPRRQPPRNGRYAPRTARPRLCPCTAPPEVRGSPGLAAASARPAVRAGPVGPAWGIPGIPPPGSAPLRMVVAGGEVLGGESAAV